MDGAMAGRSCAERSSELIAGELDGAPETPPDDEFWTLQLAISIGLSVRKASCQITDRGLHRILSLCWQLTGVLAHEESEDCCGL